ncbi:taurine ABC transporter substrate-binding protein [Pseudogemmobacter sonorensis]|uniref:taurine ABC transporter substrate-binding protein n=1 Tax=Pseudogemmobacter sonorensis TaxID=2989681 RepID=UPI0036977248
MKISITTLLCLAFAMPVSAETLIIGHFGSPTPMQIAAAEKKYDEAMGFDIEWRKFDSGPQVIAAMASGDVKLAELGSSPLAIAASQGVPLQLFMLAQVLGEAESLVARDGSGIETLDDLKGKRVATPVGSTAHFSLMGALNHAGIAESELSIINMAPDQIAAAWEQGAIDAAFVWQPVQARLRETGKLIVGADQTAAWGYPTFDGWVVDQAFAEANPDAMAAFVKVTEAANQDYLKDPAAYGADSEAVQAIAAATGADPAQVPEILEGFTFLPAATQAGADWLGGAVGVSMKATAEFLMDAGRIDSVADDYSSFVTLAPISAAME